MTSSYRRLARSMMSRCPLVTGSNDPGHTQRRTGGYTSVVGAAGDDRRDRTKGSPRRSGARATGA